MKDYERAARLWYGSVLADDDDEDIAFEQERQRRIDNQEPDGDPYEERKLRSQEETQ